MNSFLAMIRKWILDFLRVPPEPHPPSGSPGSLKIFRAGESYRRLLLLRWVFKQVLLVGAFVFWLVITHSVMPEEIPLRNSRGKRTATIQTAQYRGWITLIEMVGFTFGVLQMPFTYVMATLQYEMRWYMVTDRSLRIREGIGRVKEITLSFANIQQITVRQNPVQRLFGLSDVDVKSAGGGGGGGHQPHQAGMDSWHTGVFQHVSNAEEIRDLIVARQRAFKAAGLGDPDDHVHHEETALKSDASSAKTMATVDGPTISAAHELLKEARALRIVVEAAAVSRPQTPG